MDLISALMSDEAFDTAMRDAKRRADEANAREDQKFAELWQDLEGACES